MSRPLKVVVMTTRLPEDIWLINKIADVCQIEGIVFPRGERYREYGFVYTLKKRIRKIGFLALVNQALLIIYRLIFESRRDKQAEKEIFSDKPNNYIEGKDIDILEVADINTEEVRDFILSKAPQLVVVSGAPLLKKLIIDAFEGRIINLHPGYAPEYRGRYGAYWPVYYKEPEKVGVTVHFVDRGIDTGKILLRQRIDFNPEDTLKIVTYRQQAAGAALMVKCLSEYDKIAPLAHHRKDLTSRNYYAMGLTHYLEARRWIKRKYAVLANSRPLPDKGATNEIQKGTSG
jgi:methionyl-tRNA formyltransferase